MFTLSVGQRQAATIFGFIVAMVVLYFIATKGIVWVMDLRHGFDAFPG